LRARTEEEIVGASMKRLLALLALAGLLPAAAARAQDRFEIQVYDSETAPPLGYGLEMHLNHVFSEVHETHVTFEPHVGLTDWLELGGYFQTAIRDDGTFDYAGVKLRLKARTRRYWDDRVGLALNGEISAVPERYEENVWGSELRPIADLRVGPFYGSVNPIVTFDLRGLDAGHPQLEPCAKAALRVIGTLYLGAELYTALGPIDKLGDESVVRLLGVVDFSTPILDLNVGAGYADGTDDRWVAKVIVGLHPPAP
jgi:hypothetical protein